MAEESLQRSYDALGFYVASLLCSCVVVLLGVYKLHLGVCHVENLADPGFEFEQALGDLLVRNFTFNNFGYARAAIIVGKVKHIPVSCRKVVGVSTICVLHENQLFANGNLLKRLLLIILVLLSLVRIVKFVVKSDYGKSDFGFFYQL